MRPSTVYLAYTLKFYNIGGEVEGMISDRGIQYM